MGNDHPYSELRDKIMPELNWHSRRLVEKAKLNDDYPVFSRNGKVVKGESTLFEY